ncbi:putative C6 transcription factor [Aspergillus homomorphus CBS 101889]|uniref:C6 transcription factor n=1 Tax=Aspergillus homomorphus (strain CBS 101889) TaxID=1450537 RepID=A0A395I893_ASPHC|nr:C6 transcription factor [Aspergillus homomorphus CBS 101889]RAL16291.1 C6 transcription factor [Aspergillus homomorphus CBS 101889]
MRHLVKKACDECIARKVRCTGTSPCDTCRQSPRQVKCTYLKPVQRRGPKVRRFTAQARTSTIFPTQLVVPDPIPPNNVAREHCIVDTSISLVALAYVVRLYQQSSYSVWPVINTTSLLQKLDSVPHVDTLCLAMALSAATMAQLQLPPLSINHAGVNHAVDCTTMAAECMRLRASSYREHLDLRSILVSFFLHVYHAKTNRRNSAMMFIQEAISGARLLGLDAGGMDEQAIACDADVIANKEVVFLLLWISERGYAMHLGLQPSYTSPIVLPDTLSNSNAEVKGLLDLGRLFATFDKVSAGDRNANARESAGYLAETEAALSALPLNYSSARMADYCITKEWMRTIIWQKALSQRLLSSVSQIDLLTFRFPAVVGRALLCSLQGFTETDLLPLGRDQLLKCFEVTNSLADIILFTMPASRHSTLQWRPQDFLHALYQKLLPFLQHDPMLKSLLRAKTAEALVNAPALLLGLGCDNSTLTEEVPSHSIDSEDAALAYEMA